MPLDHCFRVAPPFCIYLVVDFSPCRFLCCSFFPATFRLVITAVIDFPYVTYALTSFFPTSFLLSHVLLSFRVPLSLPQSLLSLFLPCHLLACQHFCCSFSICFPCNHPPSSQSLFPILTVTTLRLQTSLPII